MKQRQVFLLIAAIMVFALIPAGALAVEHMCVLQQNLGNGMMTENLALYTEWKSQSAPALSPTSAPEPTVANPQTGGGMTIQKAFIGAVIIALAVSVATFIWIKKHKTE